MAEFKLGDDIDPIVKLYIDKFVSERISRAFEAPKRHFAAMQRQMKAMEERMEEVERRAGRKRAALIASKGTLDMAYPPLLLATGALSMGIESAIFFTLYGVNILKKNASLKVSPVANPAMPMPRSCSEGAWAWPGWPRARP